MTQSDMELLKNLARGIPTSPYSWKMTSQKKRKQLIESLVENRETVLQLDLPMLIEAEFYTLEDGNDSQTFEALRTIKDVLMKKYYQLKDDK